MSQHDHTTEFDPLAADMAPTLAEARRDEAAMRRRPVLRDPQDGPAALVESLGHAVLVAQRLSRDLRR